MALANALQIAPGDLERLPVPAPANGHTDSATDEVRLALLAVSRHRPGGQVAPVEVLVSRVHAVQDALHQCRQAELASMLPALIRDVHTSLAAGRDVAELLDLAVILHTQGVSHWLRIAGASVDLRRDNDGLGFGAEQIHPHRVQRDPFAREMLVELLAQSRRDAVGRELRGMAFRAGLPV